LDPLEKCFGHHLEKSTIAPPLEKILPTPVVELKTKTRNALKYIDSLLRVALKEIKHFQFEKLITKFGRSAVNGKRIYILNICSCYRFFVFFFYCVCSGKGLVIDFH